MFNPWRQLPSISKWRPLIQLNSQWPANEPGEFYTLVKKKWNAQKKWTTTEVFHFSRFGQLVKTEMREISFLFSQTIAPSRNFFWSANEITSFGTNGKRAFPLNTEDSRNFQPKILVKWKAPVLSSAIKSLLAFSGLPCLVQQRLCFITLMVLFPSSSHSHNHTDCQYVDVDYRLWYENCSWR